MQLLFIFICNRLSHNLIDNFGSVLNERITNLLLIEGEYERLLLTNLGKTALFVLNILFSSLT